MGRVGPYELEAWLRSTQLADVFSSHHGGRPVAVSRLRPGSADGLEERFQDEADLRCRLDHPGILQTLDAGVTNGIPWFVTELVEGRTLRSALQRGEELRQALTADAIAHVALSVTEALEYLHGLTAEDGSPLHLVHRGVAPEHVLVGERGEVKLTDFGLAWRKRSERQARTRLGHSAGAAMYMAPELIVGRWFDGRADLFSFGILLLELLTGRHPCAGQQPMDAARRMMQGQIPRPPKTGSPLRDGLAAIAMRCLEPQAEKRFVDAADLHAALMKVVGARSRLGMRRALSEAIRKLADHRSERSTQVLAVPVLETEPPRPKALQSGNFEVITMPQEPVPAPPVVRGWWAELWAAVRDELAMIGRRLLGR